jgi:hypothetical protein
VGCIFWNQNPAGILFRVNVNLRVDQRAVNYPLVVQWHGANTKFFEIPMRDWIRVNVASDAGFGRITLSHGAVGRIAKNFPRLIIHMSSTGNAEQLSALSRQLSVEPLCLRRW